MSNSPPKGQHQKGEAPTPTQPAKVGEAERLKPSRSPDVASLESNVDAAAAARMAALNNWGENAKRKKNSTVRGRGGSNL